MSESTSSTMYLWLPLIFDVLIMFVLSRMNVEDANKKLKAEKKLLQMK